MRFTEYLKIVLASILAHKMRSLLAILGIIWGAFTLIMLFAIGTGIFNYNKSQLKGLLNPVSFIVLEKTTLPYKGFGPGRQLSLSFHQLQNLSANVPAVDQVSPYNDSMQTVTNLNKSAKTQQISGVFPNYFVMFGSELVGRPFTEREENDGAHVVVLSSKLKARLFGKENALGKTVVIAGVPFRVVGYPAKSSGMNINFNTSFIPFSIYQQLFKERIKVMLMQLHKGVAFSDFKGQLTNYLANLFHASPADHSIFMAYNLVEVADSLTTIIWSVRLFLAFCGLMTLIVGGISIANMMVLVIKERTPIIGLQMALGATPRNIIIEFLLETVVLVFLGSFIAAVLTSLLLAVLNNPAMPAWLGYPHIDWGVALIISLLLFFTALIAGYFPAKAAATMSPVDALAGGK